MGHTAFECETVLDAFNPVVESLECKGDQLLVGSGEGSLLVMGPDARGTFTVQDSYRQFAKKPVSQLKCFEPGNLLIALTDVVQLHSLETFNQCGQLIKTKGCNLFALSLDQQLPQLCCAVRKKLVLYEWDGSEFRETKELVMPDTAKSLLWCGSSLCVGYRREYNLINALNGAVTELFNTGKNASPLALDMQNELLLGRDNIGIFVNHSGKPTRKFGLSWSEPPVAIVASHPYVVAALPSLLEVRTVDTQVLVQMVRVKASMLIASSRDGTLYAASASSVYQLKPLAVSKQVQQLMDTGEFEEALALCNVVPENQLQGLNKSAIRSQYAHHLFSSGEYQKAMSMFSTSDNDPEQVIALFPDLCDKPKPPTNAKSPQGQELSKATASVIVYLSEYLQQNPKAPAEMLVRINTALVKAYMVANPDGLARFLATGPKCDVQQCDSLLTRHKRYKELVEVYRHAGQHRSALEMLRKFDLVAEAVKYLQTLGQEHEKLVLEFSRWILKANVKDGLQVFCSKTPQSKTLDVRTVLMHLKAVEPKACIPYLEHVTQVRNESTSQFHDELILLYLDNIMALKADPSSRPASGSKVAAGSEPGELGAMRRKLLLFLETSRHYSADKMLAKLPRDQLYEETSILLSRLAKHEESLTIYVHRLKNQKAAEDYCEKNYGESTQDSQDVYLSLLRVYLKPPDGIPPMLNQALNLMTKHFSRINPAKALELLPADTVVRSMQPFFDAVMRKNNELRRMYQVERNLLKTQNLQVREESIALKSQSIRVSRDRMCNVCGKRIGTSVFAYFPDGTVVHLMCAKDIRSVNPIP